MCVFNSISNEKPAEKLDNYSIPGNLNFLKLKKCSAVIWSECSNQKQDLKTLKHKACNFLFKKQ